MIKKLTKQSLIGNGSISASKKQLTTDCATHWHEFYEIEYVISGQGTCFVNGEGYEMKAGCLFFMTPADFHAVQTKDATVINIMFSADMATQEYLSKYTELNVPKMIFLTGETHIFLEMVLLEIVKNKNNNELCSALIDTLLLKLSENFNTPTRSNTYTLAQKMCFYIINNFRTKITLDDMAKHIGLTPTYASTVFKAQNNMGFKQYLNNLRFEYSKNLLLYSNYTVQQICEDCGFDDYPNFIRRFKIRFGVSPTQFRKTHLKINR